MESRDFRFSCGHFVAYDGYRERLHGHTYTVKMCLGGRLNSDGYVVDFNLCKRIVREICNVSTRVGLWVEIIQLRIVQQALSYTIKVASEYDMPRKGFRFVLRYLIVLEVGSRGFALRYVYLQGDRLRIFHTWN